MALEWDGAGKKFSHRVLSKGMGGISILAWNGMRREQKREEGGEMGGAQSPGQNRYPCICFFKSLAQLVGGFVLFVFA